MKKNRKPLVGEDTLEEEIIKERRNLVGKIFSDRYITREIVKVTMWKIRRINKQVAFTKVERNTFMITFATETDKYRVVSGKLWSGKLWLFNESLFAIKDLDGLSQIEKAQSELESFWVQFHEMPIRYMDRFHGNLIGNTIGKVLEVDTEENDNMGWGEIP